MTKTSLKRIAGTDCRDLDIIFVHGLTGDPQESWTSKDTNGVEHFWPSWLHDEFNNACIYTIGYPTGFFKKWATKELDMYEKAEHLLELAANEEIGEKPIVFVAHSLGGILTKQILRASKQSTNADWKKVWERTRLVTFLATPHTGAGLASAIDFIFPRLSTSNIALLSNDNGYLEDLNKFYRDAAPEHKIRTLAYYEKNKTKAALIVDRQSADPGVHGVTAIALEENHISICKPLDKDSILYRSLCRNIKTLFSEPIHSNANTVFDNEDYTKDHCEDRRDLQQKLIDADREHEFSDANNLQNKFAQKYLKHGLYTDAKRQSDRFLEDVEQYFKTHVYHAKICKNANEEEIHTALQSEVIDPLCKKYAHANITSKTVMKALYFLTGKCYIRWDAQ